MAKPKKDKAATPQPTINPPGKMRRRGHGPQSPVDEPRGVTRLREALELSADVPVEQVCEDAAVEIETLRTKQTAEFSPRPKLSEVV